MKDSWVRLAAVALMASACASAPPASPTPAGPSFAQKMSWIIRLEDRRQLRDPVPEPPPPPPVPVKGKKPAAMVPPPAPPDLTRLLADGEARVRRRAALAVGRVGLRDGVQPLVAVLSDADPEVRQMAAFALGLIGDASARQPLVKALEDQAPIVRASAAEALGLIGDASDAAAIGRAVSQAIAAGAVSTPPAEDVDGRRDVPASVVRLGLVALTRLKAYDAVAAAVLDNAGQPRTHWWPVAFALQRLEDRRALPALLTLAKDPSLYTRTFALKGLGALKDRSAVPVLLPLVSSGERPIAVEAIRALGRIGDPSVAPALMKVAAPSQVDLGLRLEALNALGSLKTSATEPAPNLLDSLLDSIGDRTGAVRSAAIRAVSQLDPQNFVMVLSGLDPDPDWRVRAALASTLGDLTAEVARPRLMAMLSDQDQRVVPSVLDALVKLRAADIAPVLLAHLRADDPVVRAAAARGVAALKVEGGAQPLAAAYDAGQRDTTYVARAAALAALAAYGRAAAEPVLRNALHDKDWAVRVRAAALLTSLDPTAASDVASQIRPAPSQWTDDAYARPALVEPPVSTSAYVETDRGTIQIELAVLDAPLTVENFVTLARRGFFDGLTIHRVVPDFVVQDGDPRGDGEGGPGYTIRDELNQRPYLRGVVGMALDWADTGGSQFFITHSPQPHLDAKYTVFGRVVDGMSVVDAIQPGDVIRRVRIWDGTR